jgi:hypothetical protein
LIFSSLGIFFRIGRVNTINARSFQDHIGPNLNGA